MFHEVQHDECDDGGVAKLCDDLASTRPTKANQSMCVTTYVSVRKKILDLL